MQSAISQSGPRKRSNPARWTYRMAGFSIGGVYGFQWPAGPHRLPGPLCKIGLGPRTSRRGNDRPSFRRLIPVTFLPFRHPDEASTPCGLLRLGEVPMDRPATANPVTAREIILEIVRNMKEGLEPLHYSTLAPAVYHVYLHPGDMERLRGILPRIVDEARRALDAGLDSLNRASLAERLKLSRRAD